MRQNHNSEHDAVRRTAGELKRPRRWTNGSNGRTFCVHVHQELAKPEYSIDHNSDEGKKYHNRGATMMAKEVRRELDWLDGQLNRINGERSDRVGGVLNTLREIIPEGVNTIEESEWEELEMAVDSGATETVIGEDARKRGHDRRRGQQEGHKIRSRQWRTYSKLEREEFFWSG